MDPQYPFGDESPEMARARRDHQAEEKAKALVEQLGKFVNGMQDVEADAFATALANEHPTLLGQIAKAVGIGVMRRSVYDPAWKPYDSYDRGCMDYRDPEGNPIRHAMHDGRLSCTTVVGAELMARQGYI